ncbi:MAG: DJ-1/PfpI family protein [Candidatus Aenigmatarchaeota archaeon]
MKALVLFADGFEEIEAFTVVDVLRRANVDVTTVGLTSTVVEGAHKIRFIADKKIMDINPNDFDALILPGGPGYKNLANSNSVLEMINDFNKKKKIIGAICASPAVLAKAGILEDKIATIYPGMESELPRPRDAKVIVAENVVTSRSPGTAMEFAFKLAEILAGKNAARKIRESFLIE